MRVDKYLWCVRYFKTRSLATKACRKGQVKINGEAAKASREVFATDELQVRKNQIDYHLKVLDHPRSRVGAKLVDIYRMDTTPKENLEKLDLLHYNKEKQRKKGTGRPTKKDRREIDDWFDNTEEDLL